MPSRSLVTGNMNTARTTRLRELQDDYTYRLNMLLEDNREDLAAKLADQYLAEAHALCAS